MVKRTGLKGDSCLKQTQMYRKDWASCQRVCDVKDGLDL